MNLQQIHDTAIAPALALLPAAMNTPRAEVQLLAAGLQESLFEHRFQVVDGKPGAKGPARGFWQFERGSKMSRGGVWGVYLHDASRYWLHELCKARNCAFEPFAIWASIEFDDVLAAGVARLLLFTDPYPLPQVDDERDAWHLYARTWRPGHPHPETWAANHRAAREFVAELEMA